PDTPAPPDAASPSAPHAATPPAHADQPPPSPADPEDDDPSFNHARTGFVARLPKNLRDQVSQMILDGVPFEKIIESLGEAGKHLTRKHIGSWKRDGGYDDWLADRERNQALTLTRDSALDLV